MMQEADVRALSVSHAAIALAGPHNGAALWGSGCAAVLQPTGMLAAVRLDGRGQPCDIAQFPPNCILRAMPAGATGMASEHPSLSALRLPGNALAARAHYSQPENCKSTVSML